jgi:hypothetical protein
MVSVAQAVDRGACKEFRGGVAMKAWGVVGSVAVLLVAASIGRSQTYSLVEAAKTGDCFRVQLEMKLTGEMRIQRDGKVVSMPEEATATHDFTERVLQVSKDGVVEKAARVYASAKAVIVINKDRSERTLRTDRKLVVVQRVKDQTLVYCPAAALSRPELDLTGGHFDTFAMTSLLPGKAVPVGDTWKVPSAVAQAVCGFEGLTEHSLTGKLTEVKDDSATFTVTGTANGIDVGAQVKLSIEATGTFDLKSKRLVGLEWKQKDEREAGPVSPATRLETKTTMLRKPIEQPESLSDVALVSVPGDEKVPAAMLQLEVVDSKNRFTLYHGREWNLVAQTEDHTILRMMDRGDFLAQVTISPWKPAPPGKHLAVDDFKAAMNAMPGWELDKELQDGEVPVEGKWAYRYSVLGQLDGVEVLQNFYLVAAPGGEQVVLVFTLSPKQAEKLGARDLALVAGLEVPAPGKK